MDDVLSQFLVDEPQCPVFISVLQDGIATRSRSASSTWTIASTEEVAPSLRKSAQGGERTAAVAAFIPMHIAMLSLPNQETVNQGLLLLTRLARVGATSALPASNSPGSTSSSRKPSKHRRLVHGLIFIL